MNIKVFVLFAILTPGVWSNTAENERVQDGAKESGGETFESLETSLARSSISNFCNEYWGREHNFTKSGSVALKLVADDSEEIMLPINAPNMLFRHPHFHLVGNVTIFFTGWNTTVLNPGEPNADPVELLHKAYRCRGTHNFLIMDTGAHINSFLDVADFDFRGVTKELSENILELLGRLGISRVHLIGHGVGAHVAGLVGRNFYQTTGKLLPRITGLDPANICLQEHIQAFGLQRGDADFVDIIHSAPYSLGIGNPNGDVDFYIQRDPASDRCDTALCSHFRSVDYFARTVPSKMKIRIAGCRSISGDTKSNECNAENIPLGIETPKTAKGNYIITESPQPLNLVDLRDCYEKAVDNYQEDFRRPEDLIDGLLLLLPLPAKYCGMLPQWDSPTIW